MRVGIPTEIKNNEYRVAITPAGVAELTRRGHEVLVQAGAGDRLGDLRQRLQGRRRADGRDGRRRLGRRRPPAQGQGAHRGRVRPDAQGPDALHVPAPGRIAALHRCTDGVGHHVDRLRDRADRRRRPPPAGADERGRGSPRRTGRRLPPDAHPGRARRADGRRPRRRSGQGRGDRRRHGRRQRRRRRLGHGRTRHRVRPERQHSAEDRRRIRRRHRDPLLVDARARGRGQASRPGHRRGAGPGRQGSRSWSPIRPWRK